MGMKILGRFFSHLILLLIPLALSGCANTYFDAYTGPQSPLWQRGTGLVGATNGVLLPVYYTHPATPYLIIGTIGTTGTDRDAAAKAKAHGAHAVIYRTTRVVDGGYDIAPGRSTTTGYVVGNTYYGTTTTSPGSITPNLSIWRYYTAIRWPNAAEHLSLLIALRAQMHLPEDQEYITQTDAEIEREKAALVAPIQTSNTK